MTRSRRRGLIALLVFTPLLVAWLSIRPRTDRVWSPDMALMPAARFEAGKVVPVTVSRTSTVQVEGAWDSVPSTWKHVDASAHVAPADVTITCRGQSTVKPRQHFGRRAIA